MLEAEVVRIAHQVRRKVVRWVKGTPGIDADMCGACAIASYALWKVLRAHDYPAEFIVSIENQERSGHAWVELDEHIIDLTATQFEGPTVAIFPLDEDPSWDLIGVVYRWGSKLRNEVAVREAATWCEQSPLKFRVRVARMEAEVLQTRSELCVS